MDRPERGRAPSAQNAGATVSYTWGTGRDQGEQAFDAVTRFIASQPGGIDRLLAEHRPDANGRCCGCRTPGTGTPDKRWPCSIASFATAARRRSA